MITRRDFLRHTRTAGLVLLAGYFPRYSQSAAIGQEQKGLYAFDANIRFFYGLGFSVKAELEKIVNDESYSIRFRVFNKYDKKKVVYSHDSKGYVKNDALLPEKVTVHRNFNNLDTFAYWVLLLSGNLRQDTFEINFSYSNGSIDVIASEKNSISDPKTPNKETYNFERIDVLTAVTQILLGLKNEKKPEEIGKEVNLIDKHGKPKTGYVSFDGSSIILEIKGEFDFKRMRVVFDSRFEPKEIHIEELYKRASIEAITKREVDFQ